jgi:hypothetical protein
MKEESIININSVKELIITKMKEHERLKYPRRIYDYYEGEINLLGQIKRAIYIKYKSKTLTNGDFTKEDLKSIAVHAIAVRKYSLITGILHAWQFSSDGEDNKYLQISEQKLKDLMLELSKQIEEKINEDNNDSPSEQVNDFIKQIAGKFLSSTGRSKEEIYELIRKAEQYFVAEYHNQVLINEIEGSYFSTVEGNIKENILQIDISHENKLTLEQRRDYLSIHGLNKPIWFTCLQKFEQIWLLQRVPKSLDDDRAWQAFEGLFKSSAMSHLPGIQNARDNYLFIKSGENETYTLLSQSVKTSTMVQYYLPEYHIDNALQEDGIDRVAHTAEQVINRLITISREKLNLKWGDVLSSTDLSSNNQSSSQEQPPFKGKPLIYNQILLSEKGAASDKLMADLQQAAIDKLAKKHDDTLIVSGNDPVNILRVLGLFDTKNEQWQHNDCILKYAYAFKARIQLSKLNDEQQKELNKIDQACIALEDLNGIPYGSVRSRNYNAYKAALTEILVETLGGVVTTNCKSGKDRTGLQELYHHSMLVYYNRYQVFPSYSEKSKDIKRINFKMIAKTLFYSLKLAESAAGNTPGSFGVNDKASMADKSFKKWLLYQLSNLLSVMNKPKVFINDQKKDANRKKKLDEQAANEKLISDKQDSSIPTPTPEAKGTTDEQVPDVHAEEREVISSEKKSTFWQRNTKLILKSLVLPICLAVVGAALTATGVFAPLGVGLLAYSVFAISPLALGVIGGTAAVVLNEWKRPKHDSESDRQISAGNNEKANIVATPQPSEEVLKATQGLIKGMRDVEKAYAAAAKEVLTATQEFVERIPTTSKAKSPNWDYPDNITEKSQLIKNTTPNR